MPKVIENETTNPDDMVYTPFGKNSFFAHAFDIDFKVIKKQRVSNLVKIEFVLAEENAGKEGDMWEKDAGGLPHDTGDKFNKNIFVGKKVTHEGLFYTAGLPKAEKWKNKEYFNQLSVLMDIPKDSEGNFLGFIPEVSDILGKPCIVKFDYVQDRSGKQVFYNKLVSIHPWENGKLNIDVSDGVDEEDSPF